MNIELILIIQDITSDIVLAAGTIFTIWMFSSVRKELGGVKWNV